MHKQSQTRTKQATFSAKSDWKMGRDPVRIALPRDTWETLAKNAKLLGMDTEEYASFVLSIQVVRERLKELLTMQAGEAITAAFGLFFYGMPQSREGLLQMDCILATALDYVEGNPHATTKELLNAMDSALLN